MAGQRLPGRPRTVRPAASRLSFICAVTLLLGALAVATYYYLALGLSFA